MNNSDLYNRGEITTRSKDQDRKKCYTSPILIHHGRVKSLTAGTASVGQDGANTRRNSQSDRVLKENIVRVGEHPLGIGLYLFDFKPEYQDNSNQGRQFGVMADEVELILPEAVSVHQDGYRMVNYAMLGIERTDN